MNYLRRISTPRLLLVIVAACAVLAGGAALAAGAISGSGPKPPAKPLAVALHDAAGAAPVGGVTARISFTNKLIDNASIGQGISPLIAGAKGRLWASADGRLRLELQSDRGDVQIVSDGKTVTLYDQTSNTAYHLTLPPDHATSAPDSTTADTPPTVAKIKDFISRLAGTVDVSGAIPDNVAGREAYTVRLAPAHDGGLVGAAELSWDAVTGTPLRAAVYAAGNPSPVLELTATDISYGPVASSDLDVTPPAGAKVVEVRLPEGGSNTDHADRAAQDAPVLSPSEVAAQVPFTLTAPGSLVGLPRKDVRLVTLDDRKAALVTYGAGLGGIAVLEQAASPSSGHAGNSALPKISIDGTDGQELATALGTIVRFQRHGVQYTIVGSVPPAAAEAAARGL